MKLNNRPKHKFAAMTVCVASLVGGMTAAVAPAPAQASLIGPVGIRVGGIYNSNISCNADKNSVRISTNVAVQTGYIYGQYVTLRYYLTDGVTGSWTTWGTTFVQYNGYDTTPVFDMTLAVADGRSYSAYVEIMWWNGSQWTDLRGQWAQKGQVGRYYTQWTGFCFT